MNISQANPTEPKIGRFLSRDPIGGTNLYAYCLNNPIKWIDPSGLDVTVYKTNCGKEGGHAFIKIHRGGAPSFTFDRHLPPPNREFGDTGYGRWIFFGDAIGLFTGRQAIVNSPVDEFDLNLGIPIGYYKTTPEQDLALIVRLSREQQAPGTFNIRTRNCASFIADILREMGIDRQIPESWFWTPDGLAKYFEQKGRRPNRQTPAKYLPICDSECE